MSDNDDNEEAGPTVESNDPDERIAARRQRISNRREAARREALGEDVNTKKKEHKEELSKSRKQIETSNKRLTKLKRDGTDLVTNIKIATDSSEIQRRREETDIDKTRIEKLEAEAKAGMERFEEITKRWSAADVKEIPQDLHELLMQQKAACDAMIDEKNKLINDFQMELKTKDDSYVKDLKKEAENIDLMIERMEDQMKNLMKAYREELTEIESAFVMERGEQLSNNRKKWELLMSNRRDKEIEYMKNRQKRVEDNETALQQLRVQDAEEYNMVKIKMEGEVQTLEQQLQQMKATYQLNQEKLEYNFQVLKKRDDENTITKAQQKRKITRLQDVLNNLKTKLSKQEKGYRDENQNLTEDYKRITEQFKQLQKKAQHFQATDAKKFHDVWVMNEQQAKELVNSVLDADRVITEQKLGLPYLQPDLSFMSNVGPIVVEKKKMGRSATEVLHDVMTGSQADIRVERVVTEYHDAGVGPEDGSADVPPGSATDDVEEPGERRELSSLSVKTIRSILELLCDEAGFLVEEKLSKLLKPLDKDERNLMELDAIFGALGIETEDDIHKLATMFLTVDTTPPEGEEADVTTAMADTEVAELTEGTGAEEQQTPVLIHRNNVVTSLRQFVEDHRKPIKEKRIPTFNIQIGESRDDSLDTPYWLSLSSTVPPEKEKVWTALEEGLEKYHKILQERSKYITETDGLRQQNSELRLLLNQYLSSKVNTELEIPPTKVLQLESLVHAGH